MWCDKSCNWPVLFINPAPEPNQNLNPPLLTEARDKVGVDIEGNFLIEELNAHFSEKKSVTNLQAKDDLENFTNAIVKSCELETLNLTLKRQNWGNFEEL